MQLNPEFCFQNKMVPIDRHFRPQFIVDWCKFHLVLFLNISPKILDLQRNVTLLKELEQLETSTMPKDEEEEGAVKHFHAPQGKAKESGDKLVIEPKQMPAPPVYYIWESVLVVKTQINKISILYRFFLCWPFSASSASFASVSFSLAAEKANIGAISKPQSI